MSELAPERRRGDPAQIGRFRIDGRIGSGAMGVVYSAHDEVMGRQVALKVLIADLESDPDTRARFYREALAAARVIHPNVITIFDAGEDDGRSFIAMQLLHGAPLARYLTSPDAGALERKIDLMIQMCEGLSAAHAHEVVHRDLKPSNLFVQMDGLLKILDFGVARLAGSNMTAAGTMLGTPDYMSPEQARGTQVSASSDIFSAGSVFYFMLAGHKPFKGPNLRGGAPAAHHGGSGSAALLGAAGTGHHRPGGHGEGPGCPAGPGRRSAGVARPVPPAVCRGNPPARRVGALGARDGAGIS